jgi:hypothetical protein
MAGQLVMKNTFWELELTPEELQFTVQERRQRAYTDLCQYSSSFTSTDLGSFTSTSAASTEMGSSSPVSSGSAAGDVSDRWADICDSDDDESLLPPTPPSRPEGKWFSQQSTPSRPAGTWYVQPSASPLETQMAAAMGKAKERAAVEAKSAKDKTQSAEKQPQPKVTCDPSERTTLVLRKLPKNETRASLLDTLDKAGLNGLYDFVYLPMDFKKGKVFGHAIINFTTNESAVGASAHFAGKGATIEWSDSHQGFDALIQRYRNSPIMHETMPEASKPLIFEDGLVVPFPSPTEEIQPLAKN